MNKPNCKAIARTNRPILYEYQYEEISPSIVELYNMISYPKYFILG